MLITVIVPIYNMEAYLCTSLDRLLQQSFQDYEILLIDDGSKDSSGEICDRYAREHSRIRVVHKPNGGLSTARNAGIEHARGEYLTFCDPDDWVDADYLQQFVEAGMDEHTLPVTGILQHREGKSDRRLTAPAMDVQGQACTEAIVALRRHDMLGFTVNKLLVGAYHTYPMAIGTAMGIVPMGKGSVLFSTLDIYGNIINDSAAGLVAKKLIFNMIDFK